MMEVMKRMKQETPSDLVADEYVLTSYFHSSIILYELNDLRKEGKLCDVIIDTGQSELPAHKCILSAFSPRLKSIIETFRLTTKKSIISFHHIKTETMQLILDYAYTGTVTITKTNCRSLLAIAYYFSVIPVINATSNFLASHLNINNFLEMYKLAELYALKELKEHVLNFGFGNFNAIIENEYYIEFSADDLIRLTGNDRLEVEKEEVVFFVVKKWFDNSPEQRIQDLYRVLATVRFPLLDPYFLHDCPDILPSIKNNEECMQLIEDAKLLHFLPDRSSATFTYQTRPRDNIYAGRIQIIALFGGTTAQYEEMSTAEGYRPGFAKQYSLKIQFPVSISSHSTVQYGKYVYMLGGCQNGEPSRDLWKYEVHSSSWLKMAPMEVSRCYFGMTALDGYLYAIGGGIADQEGLKKQFDSVERYSQTTNSWCCISSLNDPLICPAVVAYDQKIYVAGGANYKNVNGKKSLYRYDPKENSWTELTPMLYKKWGAAACAFDGFIYVIGGCYTNTVLRYDVNEDVWEEISPINRQRARFGITVINNKIYILGGMETENYFNDTVECYIPEISTWQIVGKMVSPRESFGCVSLNIEKSLCQEIKSEFFNE